MIKNNNKGFTLLELIISIFILTTVIFLGYRVINKSTIDVKNQSNINKGQLTVNDMNVYLTKDLERASSVVLSSSYLTQINTFTDDSAQENKITNANLKDAFVSYSGEKPFDYSYNINYKENNFGVIYEVNITKKDENNYNYTIQRTDKKDGVSITFINNGIIKKDEILDKSSMNIQVQLPFEISLDSPYKVYLGYNGKNNNFEKHEFTVTSRLYEADGGYGNNTIPPDIPEEIIPEIPPIPEDIDKENSLCIGYWMLDESKYNPEKDKGNLYAWIDNNGDYGKQGSNKDKFYIRGDNANGNSGKSNAYMRNPNESKNLIEVNNTSNKANNLYKIKIYVSPYTTVEQTKVNLTHATFEGIVDVKTSKELVNTQNTYTLQGNETGKWYEVKFKLSNNGKANFVIDGILSIDKSKVKSGYAMIVYGNKANEGTGDNEEESGPSGPSNNYLWYCLEMAKKSFTEAYHSVLDENIKNDLINIITPIINISKDNPLDNDKYNEISKKIEVLNDNIENLLSNNEGCLSSEDKYKVVEILTKGKIYLDIAQKTIEVSPDDKLPDPPNGNLWNNYVSKLGDTIKNEINSIKNKVANVKAALNNNTKYTLQYKSLAYMESTEYPKLDQYFQNQIYAIIKDKILDQNVKVDSESKREEYNNYLYTSIDNINRMIESIIHVQFELEKIIKILDNDVEYQKNELIKSVNELKIVNEELVIIKSYLEQATYKDEKIEIYEDIFGEHSH